MYTNANWKEFIAALTTGERCQIDSEIFEYFLGVLPPRWMGKTVKVGGEWIHCDFGTGEGMEATTAFWQKGDQYFCQEEDQFNPNDLVVGGKYRYYNKAVGRFFNLVYVGPIPGRWGTEYKFDPDEDRDTSGCGHTLSAYHLNNLEPIKETDSNV
jgi:hypothetical protein